MRIGTLTPGGSNTAKKKIAFLGGGAYTISNYRAVLEKLGSDFDLTLYSEFHFEAKQSHSFKIRTTSKVAPRRLRSLRFTWMIFKDHCRNPYDAFYSHSTYPSGFWGTILSAIFRIPIIVSLDAAEASGLKDIDFGDCLSPRRKRINKWVIKYSDRVIALTEFQRNEVQKNFGLGSRIEVVPRGVDCLKFKFVDKPIGNPVRFINVSYLHPVKDQETLLKAFAIIDAQISSTLTHIGEDFHNGKIHEMVRTMGLEDKVFFEGLVSSVDLPGKYAQADILLHTSRYESQAVVINEALASGVLVCGTHVGLMADLAGTCCKTVAPRGASELADVVLEMLGKPEEIRQLRLNGYHWATQHDLNWSVTQLRDIINKTICPE